jgi:hypothetical protein
MKPTENLTPFKKEILYTAKLLNKTQKSMDIIMQNLEYDDINGANQAAVDLIDYGEKFMFIARQILSNNKDPQVQKMYEKIITDNIPVHMGFTPEGWFGVVMPALLPKKQKGSAEYIREYLYLAMNKFFRDKQSVRYTDCVLIFRHIYKRDRPERQYRDHDNIELNMVIDILALYVLFDDTALRCEHHYYSMPGNENRTEIFVVPQSEHGSWIANAKNKAMILNETLP